MIQKSDEIGVELQIEADYTRKRDPRLGFPPKERENPESDVQRRKGSPQM